MFDPRRSLRYARMNDVIDLIDTYGPQTLDDICNDLGLTYQQFRDARYSLPGMLAMEDREVVIPRPVTSEGYVYKLASQYRTGNVDEDGEPNIQTATSDLLTRTATIYIDVDRLVSVVPKRSVIYKLLRKLQKSLVGTLDRTEDVALNAEAPVSAKAQHVLDIIA